MPMTLRPAPGARSTKLSQPPAPATPAQQRHPAPPSSGQPAPAQQRRPAPPTLGVSPAAVPRPRHQDPLSRPANLPDLAKKRPHAVVAEPRSANPIAATSRRPGPWRKHDRMRCHSVKISQAPAQLPRPSGSWRKHHLETAPRVARCRDRQDPCHASRTPDWASAGPRGEARRLRPRGHSRLFMTHIGRTEALRRVQIAR